MKKGFVLTENSRMIDIIEFEYTDRCSYESK